jgi:hypothetical protein
MTFRELVTSVLLAVDRDAPECGRQAAAALGERLAMLRVGDEAITLAARGERVVVREAPADSAEIELRASARAVVDLVDGRVELLQAIEDARLHVAGTPDDLIAMEAAVRWFIGGAVRSRGPAQAWRRHREAVTRRHAGSRYRGDCA